MAVNFHAGLIPWASTAAARVSRELHLRLPEGNLKCRIYIHLGSLGGEEVQTLVKFADLPSPHPGSFFKAPMPLPWGEGDRR